MSRGAVNGARRVNPLIGTVRDMDVAAGAPMDGFTAFPINGFTRRAPFTSSRGAHDLRARSVRPADTIARTSSCGSSAAINALPTNATS